MRNLIFIIAILSLFSCQNPMNKSVLKPLTIDELKKAISKDTLFTITYEIVVQLRERVLTTDLERVKWSDLNYNRVNNALKTLMDEDNLFQQFNNIYEEWSEHHKYYSQKIDSISEEVKKYKEENSLEQYLNVELEGLYKRILRNQSISDAIYFKFKLTPAEGIMLSSKLSFLIVEKKPSAFGLIRAEKNICSGTVLETAYCRVDDNLKSNLDIYTIERPVKKLTIRNITEEFLNRFDIFIEVEEVHFAGKRFKLMDLNIHWSIERYWLFEKYSYVEEGIRSYGSKIVEHYLGESYYTFCEYVDEIIFAYFDKIDKQAFDFLRLSPVIDFDDFIPYYRLQYGSVYDLK